MSQVKLGQQPIEEEIRDNFFKQIRHKNNNNICLDCQKKNPKWASIHLGIHLCIDCAGKHRQYGVIYSFVKSTNLDVWNQKQLLYMQKGGNERAIQYFKKCGIISNNNKHIDYKSPVVQKYRTILTQEVQSELTGEPIKKVQKIEKKQEIKDMINNELNKPEVKQIPNAEQVTEAQKPKKKKDKKKKMGNQIVIQNFQQLIFDDGVSKQQKDKIVKQYEKQEAKPQQKKQSNNSQEETTHTHQSEQKSVQPPKPQIKQLTQQESIKKLEQFKSKNLKQISSQQFQDTSISNVALKQKLNTFSGATSISSSSFNNQPQQSSNQAMQKVKSFVSNTGGKLISNLSSYWSK